MKSYTLSELMAGAAQLCNQGEWERAIIIYNKCLQANPRYIDALYNLGVCYTNLGDFEKALEQYERVLELNSIDVEANYNSGVAHSQLGNTSKAIDAYKRTLEIDERYLAAWVNLAKCYHQLAADCLEQAIARADSPSLKADLERQREALVEYLEFDDDCISLSLVEKNQAILF